MMTAIERREAILDALCVRRQDTYENLAQEFGVSYSTIRRDIEVLACSYPIEPVRGRHGGGSMLRLGTPWQEDSFAGAGGTLKEAGSQLRGA